MDTSEARTENCRCSVCHSPISEGDSKYPIAQKEFICAACYNACGFGNATATNCLSVEDVKYIKAVKAQYPDESPPVQEAPPYLPENSPEAVKTESTTDAATIQEAREPVTQGPDSAHGEDQEAQVALAEDASKELGAEQGNPQPTPEEFIPPAPEIGPDPEAQPRKKSFFHSLGKRRKSEQPDVLASHRATRGISAQKFEENSNKVHPESEEDEPENRRHNLYKIAAIVAVTLVVMMAIGSFLPYYAFSNGGDDTFTISQGQENQYSQEPLVPKDGYIYLIPEGTYKVTMSQDSQAEKGVVALESNSVLPSSDGKGYYENLQTLELMPGESVTLTVESDQHIYTSAFSVMDFELQS